MLAVHEIAHGQAFGQNHVLANKLFGMIANLPLGLPMSVSFKKYHLKHHRYQGDDLLDTDIPSSFETRFFTNTFTKFLWVGLQPLFYAFRPLIVYPLAPELMEVLNVVVQLSFDLFIAQTLGWHVLWLMLGGSVLSMGLHPVAGHFISEHYIMFEENQKRKEEVREGLTISDGKFLIPETCSYYGILNWVTFNVGYHVEHHDFPSIPGTRLPQVRKIAPEFYNNLFSHSSWSYVLWQYIIDPKVGPFARVKRVSKFGPDANDNQKSTTNGTMRLASNGDVLHSKNE
jgi:sphingolipid delta-4 desaturase